MEKLIVESLNGKLELFLAYGDSLEFYSVKGETAKFKFYLTKETAKLLLKFLRVEDSIYKAAELVTTKKHFNFVYENSNSQKIVNKVEGTFFLLKLKSNGNTNMYFHFGADIFKINDLKLSI